jgi:hypothetical protein
MFEVHGEELRFRLIDLDGRLRDRFELRKPRPATER